MKNAERIFRTVATYFALALAVLGAANLHARTVTNVASARWIAAGEDRTVQSNEVSFDVIVPATRLDTFTPQPGAGDHADLLANYCTAGGQAGTSPESAEPTVSTPVLATNKILIGQKLIVRLDSPQGNLDPDAIDTIEVQFKTPQGDRETITAVESAADSGVFYGSIPTVTDPPQYVPENCQLSLVDDDQIQITALPEAGGTPLATATVEAQADPYGVVFDSYDGKPINGAQITLINTATGLPAKVYAYDGVTPYPSTVISGQQVTDAAGNHYQFDTGEFVFPLTALGTYRLSIQPPAPYTAPSTASPAALALLHKPDGAPFEITPASFGATFTLTNLEPLQVDVPVDAPGADITVTKQVSRNQAQPGDMLSYKVSVRNPDGTRASREITLTDTASSWLRIRPESVRVDGQDAGNALTLAPDGHGFTLALAALEPQGEHTVSYMMTVRADAPPGQAINHATGKTEDGLEADAQAMVKIERDNLTDRMTLIGQVIAGNCGAKGAGVPGVRVMLEDGSFVVTDDDGRYHFEGLVPGTHVVQAAPETLPHGGRFVACARSTHNAGSANSFFVSGQGGSLARADFHATVPDGALAQKGASAKNVPTDREAAGAETDWLALGNGPPAFLFPTVDHNPRSPSVRVAIRHGPKQSVRLTANGEAVDPLSFEATNIAPDGSHAVSVWRAIRLKTNLTHLVASVRNADGSVAVELTRDVRFADTPMHGVVIKDQSHLVADGVSKPVLAVRLTDRYGNPVHAGVSGTFTVNSPYQSASAVEAQQSKALTGFGAASASWLVDGDDGIAHIELAPTMVSGALHLSFQFSDGDTHREEELESWVEPGDQPWTLIGLAEGAVGSESIAKNMERDGDFDSDLGKNARVAFYAKGRVLGKYLLTVAYDSAKQKADQQLLGVIDPNAYYTVFADNTQRLYDAASHEKLYVRIESAAFYALFGDFDTGFDQTELAAYQRTLTGAKGEVQIGKVHASGFVAKTGSSHVRDEIQGNGLTGPYRLSNRGILANSEHVTIQVRDRLRSELILDSRDLVRFVDYNIDQLSGTITFTQPVLSRDAELNPQFIVIDYEVDNTSGKSEWNGGARATWTSADGKVRIGATAISDKGDTGDRTTLGATDVRVRLGTTTEIRVEAAASTTAGDVSTAGSLEVEHRTAKVDVLAYAHQTDADYGVGQQNLSERGRRKFGTDARLSITDQLSLIASGWIDQSLTDDGERKAVEMRVAWRNQKTDAYLGASYLSDQTPGGNGGTSTVVEGGVTQHLLGNRLELTAASSIALGKSGAIDLPARHQFGLRYSITPNIKAIATYEIARGDAIDANTLKAGVELTPWTGGKVTTTLGKQEIGADANRTFAAVSLGQTFQLTPKLTIDATIDGNKTLGGGIPLSAVPNPAYPVPSGGQLGDDGSLGEDFTAYSLGAAWQSGQWSARVRGEYRDGEFEDQKGFSFAAIRQLGEGSVVGSGVTWTKAASVNGTVTEVTDAQISAAHRPFGADIAFLGKLEYRSDKVTGAVAGQAGPVGDTALLVDGNANSTRLIASLSTNWTPTGRDGSQRTEIAVFTALRHNFESYQGFDLKGTSVFGGVDARIGLGERFEIGGKANIRANIDEGTISYSIGPVIGFSPAENMVLSVGYNLKGFHDRDFSDAQSTDKGVFASVKMKFDAGSLNFLGLGAR